MSTTLVFAIRGSYEETAPVKFRPIDTLRADLILMPGFHVVFLHVTLVLKTFLPSQTSVQNIFSAHYWLLLHFASGTKRVLWMIFYMHDAYG